LFVRRELENSEQAFHRSVAQLSVLNSRTPFSSLGFLQVVILSKAKNLGSLFQNGLPHCQPDMFRFTQHDNRN
jgi:hypothetical protein